LLLGIAAGTVTAHAAAIYYLINTTVVTAGLFLLTELVSRQRAAIGDVLEKGPRIAAILTTGGAYLILAVAASGVPPLSGFLAKIMVMQSLHDTSTAIGAWSALLLSGFAVALVLARAASTFFWEPGRAERHPASPGRVGQMPSDTKRSEAVLLVMVACVFLVTIGAAPISAYTRATAEQIAMPARYVEAVLGDASAIKRERRP
jgi:multicomponent K+:H+ antiporter subunit D